MDAVPLIVAAMLSTTLGLEHYHVRAETTSLLDRLAWWGCLLVATLAVLSSLARD
jgi:hypothetical protein